MKNAHPVDEEHMAPAPVTHQSVEGCSTEQPSPMLGDTYEAADAYERAYAEWLKAYASQASRTWRIYFHQNDESAPTIQPSEKIGAIRHIFNGMRHFTFFPHTEVRIRWRPTSDWDAQFSDWVAVGSDLYRAIRKYRIDSSLAESNSTPVSATGVTTRPRAS